MEKQKSHTNKLLIVLLLASVAGNIYLWKNKTDTVSSFQTKIDDMMVARLDVEKELNDTYTELNNYKGINSELDSMLATANADLDKQKSRIAQLIRSERNSGSLNKKLKAELEELRQKRDQYLEQIDGLLVENEQLKTDNTELTSTVENLTKSIETTVKNASVIKSEYMAVNAFKRRSSGKYKQTALAKRTHKMEICFKVLDNQFSEAGEKNVHLRIIEPGGKTMGNRTEGSSSFKPSGADEEILFTSSKTLVYDNKNQDVCMEWEESDDNSFTPGTYLMEVYVDGNLSGATSTILR
ncbi:MAG: hypothetical protein HKN22_02380 [Bacteroidia bacterium]|nr:hypothetical protein [Bacteroidia bacterium]